MLKMIWTFGSSVARNLRSLILFVFLMHHTNGIEFKDNGYYDVLVSISPDVEATHEERVLIVDNIKVATNKEILFSYT